MNFRSVRKILGTRFCVLLDHVSISLHDVASLCKGLSINVNINYTDTVTKSVISFTLFKVSLGIRYKIFYFNCFTIDFAINAYSHVFVIC